MGVRGARGRDLESILSIYNHAVINTTSTFDVSPRSPEARAAWFSAHTAPYTVLVWEEAGENEASCRLAEKTGFRCIGTLMEVGCKFDRWLNVAIYQLRLDA